MTSHDVVATIRRALRQQGRGNVKVGHAGTLDPMATGVLVVCLGAATRLSEYVMAHTKRYRAAVVLGIETDTYDSDGSVVAHAPADHLMQADVERAASRLTGDIDQIPPMHSAIKVGGRKLYDIARAGQSIERTPRRVRIDRIDVLGFAADSAASTATVLIDVTCSAGTYIRSIAHDLGEMLGTGAHLSALERTASGRFKVEDAIPLATLTAELDWNPYLIAPLKALDDMPRIELTSEDVSHITHGRPIPAEAPDDTTAAAVYAGELAAILAARGGAWHPHKVFLHAEAG
ncbi:MAG: tRNA pseudouridine(55) synthase TruB [Chloroflexi bacterium]|nr:tRNA pseudouridine(55) synthase TruB [Chloroflexota bacterium]